MSTTTSRLLTTAAFIASLFCLGVWLPAPLPTTFDLHAQVVAGGVALAVVLAIASWFVRPAWIAMVLAAGWFGFTTHASGAPAGLAWLLFAIAAMAAGARIVGAPAGLTAIERAVVSYLVGMALAIAVLSPMLALSVHYPSTYAAACVVVIAWQRRALWTLLQDLQMQWKQWRGGKPSFGVAIAIFFATLVWGYGALGTLTPVAAFDDLAFHLRLPYELFIRHRYFFDVQHQVWSAAPLASDLAFAVPFVLAQGSEGVKAWLAASYHLGAAVLLAGLLLRRTRPLPALLCVLGYLSIPLVLAVNHTLHTEGVSAPLVLAIFALWALARESEGPGPAIGAALMLAMLGAAKSSNLVLCLALGLMWLPAFWRHARARPLVGAVIVLALATVLTPYLTSWFRTGNPVLPLFNAVFKSPYFDLVNFRNEGYAGMFNGSLFANLFLEAPRHLETGLPTAGGLGLYLLLPAAVILLAWKGDIERRMAMAVALGYSLVLLSSQQYLRYLFPVMGIGFFAVSRLWDELPVDDRTVQRLWQGWWSALVGVAVLLNVYWMPGVFWQTKLDEMIGSALSPAGRSNYLRIYAPERELTRAANADMGIYARVLYSVDPFGAELHGTPIYANWYNPRALAAMLAVKDEASAGEFMRKLKVTHMVVKPLAVVDPAAKRAVEELLKFGILNGRVIARSGHDSLIAFDDALVWPRELWRMEPEKAGTQVTSKVIVAASAPATSGMTVLAEMQGTCDTFDARPGIDVFWISKGVTLGSSSRVETCTPVQGQAGGIFAIRHRMVAPRGADAMWIRVAAYGEHPVAVKMARVRTLAP